MSKSDYEIWLKDPITICFFKELLEAKDAVLNSMLSFSSSGEDLVKDYYKSQGFASGLEGAYNLAVHLEENLAKGIKS